MWVIPPTKAAKPGGINRGDGGGLRSEAWSLHPGHCKVSSLCDIPHNRWHFCLTQAPSNTISWLRFKTCETLSQRVSFRCFKLSERQDTNTQCMHLYVQTCLETNTYQKTIKLLDQNRHHSQQTHADGKIRFFNWCWRRWSAGTLSEFYIWRKELDHKRAHSFFEEETEFLMLFAEEKKNSLSLQHPSKAQPC